MAAMPQKIRTGLVELRTKLGPVYVTPSFWERVHLLWTFRNFHSLPRQVLNDREQRLIDSLCRTAVVRRAVPSPTASIIGVVENVQLIPTFKSEIADAPKKTVAMSVSEVQVMPSRAVGGISVRLNLAAHAGSVAGRLREWSKVQSISDYWTNNAEPIALKKDARRRRLAALSWWNGWAVAGLCSLAVVGFCLQLQKAASEKVATPVAVVHASRSESVAVSRPENAHVAAPITAPVKPVLSEQKPVARATVLALNSPSVAQSKNNSSQLLPKPTTIKHDPLKTEPVAERLRIAETPQRWSYPVAPDSSLTGKVSLRALVERDGSVSEVAVLSGKASLAQAAARAVKHWKYRRHEVNGNAVEAETRIEINFLGDDAISISYSKAE
jgi:outer membrane biosynthesis protein TonB